MYEEENLKSSNKKHLKKQIEAKKKAKRSNPDEMVVEEFEDNEDNDDNDDNDNNEETEENKDKKEDSGTDSETGESKLKSNTKLDKKSKNKTNIEIKNSELNSPFSQTSSFNSPFSTKDTDISNNFDFENPKTEFDEQIENLIDIYKVINRKRSNHYNTIVKGLNYLEKDKLKTVMSKIKKSLGIGGAEINSEDIDPDNKVILFQGDFAQKIKDILVKELKRDEYYFNIHE